MQTNEENCKEKFTILLLCGSVYIYVCEYVYKGSYNY